ncbi:PorP/SprF family type IX secretion system membrane protein [Pseudofulvibacter geojedonensis]|uniref:Type IX secretion system membrane protein PorP/SprF n=1 Tax=Pseudofulvibacter geojedonensis TaxID=1123758 RepID=A0ABW3HZ40_9FLAO
MKKVIKALGVAAILFSLSASAQQTPNYSFWRQNMNLLNPAYAGSTEKTEVNLTFRDQWNGVDGGPRTQSIHGQTSLTDKMGLGLSIEQDRVFIQRETNLFANFSYKLQINDKHDIYLGIKAGGSFFSADLNNLQTADPINAKEPNRFNPNVGVGAYYKQEKFFVSLSAPRLLKAKRYEEISGTSQEAADEMLVMLGGGYFYNINDNIQLIPAVMARYVGGSPFGLDASLSARFYDKFELGGNYRLNDSASLLATFQVAETLDLGFAYEFTTSDVNEVTTGGPELLLKLKF